ACSPYTTLFRSHIPSGTSTTTVTNEEGLYTARNLRVGGPYSVTVMVDGQTETAQLGSVGIGAPTVFDVTVSAVAADSSATEVAEVVVRGVRAVRTSPTARLNLEDIETLPSNSRDSTDIV